MRTVAVRFAALLSLSLGLSEAGAVEQQSAAALHSYRCNIHTHTSARPNSDANETPEFVAAWYRAHGYQCLVITDHEFLTDVAAVNREYAADGKFLVLQGQEITQSLADPAQPNGLRHLHVNGIGTDKLIMPVGYPDPARGISALDIFKKNFAAIRAAGGVPQINHPNLQWSVRLDDLLHLPQPFLFEVWNAFSTSNNLGGVDDAGHRGDSPEALWDGLLTQGDVVWAVASDDAHEYHKFDQHDAPTPGKGWIVLQATSLTAPAIMQALRTGSFYASTGIVLEGYAADRSGISFQITQLSEWNPGLKPTARYITRFIGAHGRVLAEITGSSVQYRFKSRERYVRASIMDSDGRRAWTQPVFPSGR